MTSREKALQWFRKRVQEIPMSGAKAMYQEAVKALEQPEQKTGHWIDAEIQGDNSILPIQVCDQCNTFFPLAYTGGGHRYCPHCGANMHEAIDNTTWAEDVYPNIKEELHRIVDAVENNEQNNGNPQQ